MYTGKSCSWLGKVNQLGRILPESSPKLFNEQYSCFVCSTVVMALLRLGRERLTLLVMSIVVLSLRLTGPMRCMLIFNFHFLQLVVTTMQQQKPSCLTSALLGYMYIFGYLMTDIWSLKSSSMVC